jgi:glucose uptake protein
LLAAAIAICGLSVAFPVGIGLALVLGVLINYFGAAKGEPLYIFVGVVFIVIAILMNALAYRKASAGVKQDSASSSAGDKKTSATQSAQAKKVLTKGILLSVACGIIMSLFYRFVVASMDMENFAAPAAGKLTPYTAVVIFALGVFASNFIFNTFAMKRPVSGDPIPVSGYFKGKPITHMVGMLGGIIWCVGQSFSMIASEKAGAAISYGLGQGATLVSAAWGIFIWKEFKDAPAASGKLNAGMFVFFLIGLAFLIYAGA